MHLSATVLLTLIPRLLDFPKPKASRWPEFEASH